MQSTLTLKPLSAPLVSVKLVFIDPTVHIEAGVVTTIRVPHSIPAWAAWYARAPCTPIDTVACCVPLIVTR